MVNSVSNYQDNQNYLTGQDVQGQFDYACRLIDQQKYAAAIPVLNRLAAIAPQEPEIFARLGVSYFGLRDYVQSIVAYTKAINLDPEFGFYYASRGLSFYALGNTSAMTNDFIKGARLGDANCQAALLHRGISWS